MSGLAPGEAAVMDLWDQGLGYFAIARRLDRPLRYVKRIVSLYHDGGEEAAGNTTVAAASTALAAAIQTARNP